MPREPHRRHGFAPPRSWHATGLPLSSALSARALPNVSRRSVITELRILARRYSSDRTLSMVFSILCVVVLGMTSGCVDSGRFVDADEGVKRGLLLSNEEVGEREDGTGAFRTHCLESHESQDDPLVFPGQPGAAHHHVFFGNTTVDAFTTPASLAKATETTCDGLALNKSAYWVPALFDANGDRIAFEDPLFYYKTGYHVAASSIETLPEDLRMIAGNAAAAVPQGTRAIKFRCSEWTSDIDWFDPGDPLDHVDIIPDCSFGDVLEIRIVFPQCWDGVNLTSPDHRSHMAYPSRADPPVAGTGTCPVTHPVALPEISYNFAVHVTRDKGSPTSWRFSSDGPGTPGGQSLHADWMNGWDPEIMATIVRECLRPAKECMVGLLGDGTRLDPVVVD